MIQGDKLVLHLKYKAHIRCISKKKNWQVKFCDHSIVVHQEAVEQTERVTVKHKSLRFLTASIYLSLFHSVKLIGGSKDMHDDLLEAWASNLFNLPCPT